ncbi:hypothetical protein BKA66DRAFT_447486 [Pyrenochaeta sp. MPI-SDFR-AT-0127]|nr:hypothetical protein BKA66DRAFT_447486 [Pyrenochaeta sp. MPI-SDFR-AT-0127]
MKARGVSALIVATKWVETGIASADTALSPEQAVATWNSSLYTLLPTIEPRKIFGSCQQVGNRPAKVPEAVFCINFLSGRNKDCPLTTKRSAWAMCTGMTDCDCAGAGRVVNFDLVGFVVYDAAQLKCCLLELRLTHHLIALIASNCTQSS